jgi:hypothetical protein
LIPDSNVTIPVTDSNRLKKRRMGFPISTDEMTTQACESWQAGQIVERAGRTAFLTFVRLL